MVVVVVVVSTRNKCIIGSSISRSSSIISSNIRTAFGTSYSYHLEENFVPMVAVTTSLISCTSSVLIVRLIFEHVSKATYK